MPDTTLHADKHFRNSVLIMAHPDDEIIFASSIMHRVSDIIICFSGVQESKILTYGREKIANEYPLKNISFLNITQSRINHVDIVPIRFHKPLMNSYGIAGGCHPKDYQTNFDMLFGLLCNICKNYATVFSHNPWGEYGNHEHIQIFRLLSCLQKKFNFDLFVSGYVTARTMEMAKICEPYISNNFIMLETNSNTFNVIKNLYIKNNCWTWFDDYQPPIYEYFLQVNNVSKANTSSMIKYCYPLMYIRHGHSKQMPWYISLILDLSLYVPFRKIASFLRLIKT